MKGNNKLFWRRQVYDNTLKNEENNSSDSSISTNDGSNEKYKKKVEVRYKRSLNFTEGLLVKKIYKNDKTYICPINQIYEQHELHIMENRETSKLFISKIKKITFSINKELFDKGKHCGSNMRMQDIPDIKYWIQRYYYFHKFDEGIKMDYESIIQI